MAELTLAADHATFGSGSKVLEWAVAGAPADGETESGDRHLVVRSSRGVLLAVVDALGHGPEAAAVAASAVRAISDFSTSELDRLVERCHRALRGTRGVVIAVAWIDQDGIMTWLSVGNVDAMLMRRRFANFQRHAGSVAHAGVLGLALPRIGARAIELRSDDLLVMTTDGINVDYYDDFIPRPDLQHTARGLVEKARIRTDDALVLLARYTVLDR
jgi:phosphoserine phosphatase RsbX